MSLTFFDGVFSILVPFTMVLIPKRQRCMGLLALLAVFALSADAWAKQGKGDFTPAPDANKTRVYGYERAELLDRFEAAINFAFHQRSPDPYVYAILRTMDSDIGTNFEPQREIENFDRNKRIIAGLPISGPRGLSAMRKEHLDFLKLLGRAPDSVSVALSVQAFVASCSPDERAENERIANDIVNAKWRDKARRDVLRVLNQLRDNGCLDAKTHAKLAKPEVKWLYQRLRTFEKGHMALALYDIVHGGFASTLAPADIKLFLDAQGDSGAWLNAKQSTDMKSTLAGAYVVGYMMSSAGVPVTDFELRRFFGTNPTGQN